MHEGTEFLFYFFMATRKLIARSKVVENFETASFRSAHIHPVIGGVSVRNGYLPGAFGTQLPRLQDCQRYRRSVNTCRIELSDAFRSKQCTFVVADFTRRKRGIGIVSFSKGLTLREEPATLPS